MEQSKYIPPHSKFTSELDMRDPDEREEMNKRVFGRDYKRDADGNPVDMSNTSDFSIRNGLAKRDRIQQHLTLVKKYAGGMEAAVIEAKRIHALNPKHYADQLAPYLKTAPSKVPRASDI